MRLIPVCSTCTPGSPSLFCMSFGPHLEAEWRWRKSREKTRGKKRGRRSKPVEQVKEAYWTRACCHRYFWRACALPSVSCFSNEYLCCCLVTHLSTHECAWSAFRVFSFLSPYSHTVSWFSTRTCPGDTPERTHLLRRLWLCPPLTFWKVNPTEGKVCYRSREKGGR